MTATTNLFPPLLWAQRADYLLLTVALQDATNVRIELPRGGEAFQFSCDTPDGKHYACDLSLFRPVSAEDSSRVVRPRQVELKLKKRSAVQSALSGEEEADEDQCWPRLTLEKMKHKSIQVDWAQWKDADEEAEDAVDDLGDFGLGGGGFGDDEELNEKMMQQFMVKQGRDDAVDAVGGDVPSFGSAAGQQPMGNEDEDDDMPPLEEDFN